MENLNKDCFEYVLAYLRPQDIQALLTVSKDVNKALLGHVSSENSAAELARLLASSSPSWSPRGTEDAIPELLVKASTGLPAGAGLDLVTKNLCAVAARGKTSPPPLSPSRLEVACLAGGLRGAAAFLFGTRSPTPCWVYGTEDLVEEMKRCLLLVTRKFTDTTHLLVNESARRSMRQAFNFSAPNDDDTAPRFRVLVNALLTFYGTPEALLSCRAAEWRPPSCGEDGHLDRLRYFFANGLL